MDLRIGLSQRIPCGIELHPSHFSDDTPDPVVLTVGAPSRETIVPDPKDNLGLVHNASTDLRGVQGAEGI